MSLNGKQRRHLRGLGHKLAAVVHLGRAGVSDGVVAATEQALADHELIKVKIGQGTGLDRTETAEQLASATGSDVAQILGNTILLYRPDPEKPRIRLPAAAL